MKKLIAVLSLSLFALGVVGCGDVCTKTADMMTKCGKEKPSAKEKKKFIKECKKEKKIQKMFKKCADITDCKKYKKCMKDV